MNETCLANLNRSLTELMEKYSSVVILGEDIGVRGGGAFRVESGLAEMFPDRVISTPISEESIGGMAVGLALEGYHPIVDMMFSDFATLSFDTVVNLASKVKTMYGKDMPLPMIIRSANGGYRGYGPTHSQSMQKYFMGIPNVSVYEMSRFHENSKVIEKMLSEERLCMFFEEKTLYPAEMHDGLSMINNIYSLRRHGGDEDWVELFTDDSADLVIVAPGGISEICISAGERLLMEYEIETKIFIPSRLYPATLKSISDSIKDAGNLIIAEESTAGADWGSALLGSCFRETADLNGVNVRLIASEDSVIPADINRERKVLLNEEDIVDAGVLLIEGRKEVARL